MSHTLVREVEIPGWFIRQWHQVTIQFRINNKEFTEISFNIIEFTGITVNET